MCTSNAIASLSSDLFLATIDMRDSAPVRIENPDTPEEKIIKDSCLTTFAKRFAGELCFAGILVLSLVEAVVRAIFAIPAYFISRFCPKKAAEFMMIATWEGAKYSLFATFSAAIALVQNIYEDRLEEPACITAIGNCLLR